MIFKYFFFSSRRRHTRWTGDWSSDVCSSDLGGISTQRRAGAKGFFRDPADNRAQLAVAESPACRISRSTKGGAKPFLVHRPQIGRASCRERVVICVMEGMYMSDIVCE